MISRCDTDLCFPNDVGHLFMYLLAICLLWKNIYSDLLPSFFVFCPVFSQTVFFFFFFAVELYESFIYFGY